MSEERIAEKGLRACVHASALTEVVTEALADAERVGMSGRTRAEWVSIAILGSSHVPLEPHFPAEGGGPCPVCADCDTPWWVVASVDATRQTLDELAEDWPTDGMTRAEAQEFIRNSPVVPPRITPPAKEDA